MDSGYARALTAAALVALLLTPSYALITAGGGEEFFDGAALAEVLARLLDDIAGGRYGAAVKCINDLMYTSVPQDLEYTHRVTLLRLRKVVEDLIEINTEMRRLEELQLSGAGFGQVNKSLARLEDLVVKLYGDRVRLEDAIGGYVDKLKQYIPPAELPYYSRLLDTKIHSLFQALDDRIYYLVKYVGSVKRLYGVGAVDVLVSGVKPYVMGGSLIKLNVTLIPRGNTSLTNTTFVILVRLWYEHDVSVEYRFDIGRNRSTLVSIRVFNAEDVYKRGVPLERDFFAGLYYARIYGVVYCIAVSGSAEYAVGRAFFNTTLVLKEPPIEFIVPRLVYYGENATVRIVSSAPTAINATVLIDDTVVDNITVKPGTTLYRLPSSLMGKGYHVVAFVTEPLGDYVSVKYTSALAVVGRRIDASLLYDKLILAPFIGYTIRGSIPVQEVVEARPRLEVWVDGRLLANTSIASGSFSEGIDFPLPLLIDVYSVKIVVDPANREYDPYVAEVKVVAVNVLGVMGLSAILMLFLFFEAPGDIMLIYRMLSAGSRRLVSTLRSGPRAGKRVYIQEFTRAIRIRRSAVAEVYWRLISRLQGILPKPEHYETLREYCRRAEAMLHSRAREVFRRLTLVVERDLYSRDKPGREEAEKLARLFEDEVGGR